MWWITKAPWIFILMWKCYKIHTDILFYQCVYITHWSSPHFVIPWKLTQLISTFTWFVIFGLVYVAKRPLDIFVPQTQTNIFGDVFGSCELIILSYDKHLPVFRGCTSFHSTILYSVLSKAEMNQIHLRWSWNQSRTVGDLEHPVKSSNHI